MYNENGYLVTMKTAEMNKCESHHFTVCVCIHPPKFRTICRKLMELQPRHEIISIYIFQFFNLITKTMVEMNKFQSWENVTSVSLYAQKN